MSKLRTALIGPMCNWFGIDDMNALSNLMKIHRAGYEFESIEEFNRFLKKHWPERKLK